MRTRVWCGVGLLVVLLAVTTTASATPRGNQSTAAAALSLPSWKHVCEVIEPVHGVNTVELLGQALAGKELPALSMLLFVATPLACPGAGEQLLSSQLVLDQLIRTSPQWSTVVTWLNDHQDQLVHAPHVSRISLPSFTLATRVVDANGLVPVDVHWLQLDHGPAPSVDIEADAFDWPWSTRPSSVVTNGLRNLRAQSLLGTAYVPLKFSAWSTWQLCIKPSADTFPCTARGIRLTLASQTSAASSINRQLSRGTRGCATFTGSQVGVELAAQPAAARFLVDGVSTFWLRLDSLGLQRLPVGTRFVGLTRPTLTRGTHTLCVDSGQPAPRNALVTLFTVS